MGIPEPVSLPVLARNAGMIRNRFDAYEIVRDLCGYSGFACIAVIAVPRQRDLQLARNVVVANWPEPFIRDYDALGLFAASETFAEAVESCTPAFWDWEGTGRKRLTEERAKVRDLFRRYGFLNSMVVPVRDPHARLFLVSLCGNRPRPEPELVAGILLVSMHLVERLSGLVDEDSAAGVRLSERERQCLDWTAAGKTSGEIAAILALSEHTVNQYVTSACQKLGTVNRVQAVAKAIRLGIIA